MNNEAKTAKPKVSGLAVVRDKNGKIKADNFDNLPPEHQAILLKLIEEERNGSNT